MSFDVIVLKPSDPSVDDITAVDEVSPLGDAESVSQVFEEAFPGCSTQGYFGPGGSVVELRFSGTPVQSAHITLRYGQSWSEVRSSEFTRLLSRVCNSLNAVAFAVMDNARIAPQDEEASL